MLIVAGVMEVDPGRVQEFLESRRAVVEEVQKEPGCVDYVYMADPIQPGVVRLFERWESKETLADHLEAGRRRREAQPPGNEGVPVLRSEVLQYEIAAIGPVGS